MLSEISQEMKDILQWVLRFVIFKRIPAYMLYQFPRATVRNYHKSDDWNQGNSFYNNSEGQKARGWQGWFILALN